MGSRRRRIFGVQCSGFRMDVLDDQPLVFPCLRVAAPLVLLAGPKQREGRNLVHVTRQSSEQSSGQRKATAIPEVLASLNNQILRARRAGSQAGLNPKHACSPKKPPLRYCTAPALPVDTAPDA